MTCLLCQTYSSSVLRIFSDGGKEFNTSGIILKYFSITAEDATEENQNVCWNCWKVVFDFHLLYVRVKEVHKNLEEMQKKTIPEASYSLEAEPNSHGSFQNSWNNIATETYTIPKVPKTNLNAVKQKSAVNVTTEDSTTSIKIEQEDYNYENDNNEHYNQANIDYNDTLVMVENICSICGTWFKEMVNRNENSEADKSVRCQNCRNQMPDNDAFRQQSNQLKSYSNITREVVTGTSGASTLVKKKCCKLCSRGHEKKRRKTRFFCSKCSNPVCQQHSKIDYICFNCVSWAQ